MTEQITRLVESAPEARRLPLPAPRNPQGTLPLADLPAHGNARRHRAGARVRRRGAAARGPAHGLHRRRDGTGAEGPAEGRGPTRRGGSARPPGGPPRSRGAPAGGGDDPGALRHRARAARPAPAAAARRGVAPARARLPPHLLRRLVEADLLARPGRVLQRAGERTALGAARAPAP